MTPALPGALQKAEDKAEKASLEERLSLVTTFCPSAGRKPFRPGLARCPPDQAQGIEAEPGLTKNPDELVAMVSEIRNLSGRDLTITTGEFAEAFDFSSE